MNASPDHQRRLLEVADLDARIRRAEHARTHPPQALRVKQLLAHRQELSQELSGRLGARDDLRAELARVEADVAVVDARRARDTDRLQTVSNPKDALALESELASLARRKGDLEDTELELMERLEQADAAVAEQEDLIAADNAEGARLSADGKAAVAHANQAYDASTSDRATVSAALPAELLAWYDKLSARNAGAALLRRGTCEGCQMVLSSTDLAAVRQAPPDSVLTCPECGCILVRTDESGL